MKKFIAEIQSQFKSSSLSFEILLVIFQKHSFVSQISILRKGRESAEVMRLHLLRTDNSLVHIFLLMILIILVFNKQV